MALHVRVFILLSVGLLSLSKPSQGQITVGSVTPDPVCAGTEINTTYSTTSSGQKTFTIFLYKNGATDSTQLNQLTTNNVSGAINATIPGNITTGSYTVRIKQLITSPTTSTAISAKSSVFTINAIPSPPSVSNITYCSGASAVPLSATASPGGTILWYTASVGVAGSPTITPQTNTPGITTYFASQKVNNCESALQAMTVTVKDTPLPPLVSSTSYAYCLGQPTLTLSATLSASGGTLIWYDPSGNVLPGPPTPAPLSFFTFLFPGNRVYSVSQTNNGCESNRVNINVNFLANPAAPTVVDKTVCQNTLPTSLASAVTATGLLKWYTAPSGGVGSVDAPVPPTTTAGATNYYVSQTDGNGCESARASITYTVEALPAAPTGSPSSVTYCQDITTAVALVATGVGTLNWYTVATGGSSSSSIIPSTAASANYYVSQTVKGCEGPRATINVIINAKPAKPAVMAPVAYCQLATASPLSATATVGNSLRWYGTDASGGTPVITPTVPQTGTPGVLSYYVSQLDPTGCSSDRASILVTVNARPAAPVTVPVTVCQNTSPVSLASGVTATGLLKWYTAPTGGGPVSAPAPPTTTAGATTYYVSQTSAEGCESDRASITYTVVALPLAPTVSPVSVTYCQDVTTAVALLATASSGGTLNWYTVASGGSSSTSIIPSTAASANYYVSQTVNGCEGPRATINVTIKAKPAKPAVMGPVAYCQQATASPLSATATVGNSLRWYGTDASGGSSLPGAPTPQTGTANVLNYYVSQQDPVGCESDRASIQVTVNARPAAPGITDLNVCQNTTPVSLLSAVSATGTLNWYTAPAGGTGSTTTPILSTTAVGVSGYYVSQTDGNSCESDRVSIKYTVFSLPVTPSVAAGPLFYCQDATPLPLAATATGTLKWYTTPTGTVPLVSPVPSTSLAGSATYYVSQTDGNSCESARASVTVVTSSRPALPTITLPPAYCLNNVPASLSATAVSGNTLRWYGTDETGGTISTTPTVPATNSAGVVRYYVSQADGNGCESYRAAITVTVNALPVAPTTQPISICQNAPVPLLTSAVSAAGSLKWFTSPVSSASAVAPTLSSASVGQTTYYVTQTDGNSCESSQSSVSVTIKPLPSAPIVSPIPIILCQSSVASPLSATGTGTLVWYDPSGNASSSLTPSTATVAPSTYRVSQIVDGCEGPTASITVIVIQKPNMPTLTVPGPYCQFETPGQLAATGLNLKWFTDTVGGSFSTTAPTPTATTPGTTTYYVSQTDGNGCESDRAPIPVRVKLKPAPPGTAPVSFCANQVTAITATAATGGSLNWYGTDPLTGSPTSTAPVPATTVIGAAIPYYVSQTVEGCESDKAAVAVTIIGLPVAPTVTSTPIVYCQGAVSVALSATATGTLSWYTVLTGGTPSSVAPAPQTTVSNPSTSYYYVSQTVNGCEGPRATIAVTINTKPVQPLVTPFLVYCQNAPATLLSATAPGLLQWYADATVNTVIPAPTPLTTTPGVTSYYVSQTDGNGCISDRASITVTVLATPVAPTTTSFIFCQNAVSTPLTATPSSGGVLNWYTDPSGGVGTSTAPAPSTSQSGTFTYYVSQSVSGCEGPRAAVSVTVKALPTAPSVSSAQINTCLNAPSVALSATPSGGGTLNWYTSPAGGVPTSIAPIPPTNQEGTTLYYVSQTVNGCEGSRTQIAVVVRGVPVAPGVSASPIVYCQGTPAIALTATQTSGATLNWYDASPGSVASTIAPTPLTTGTGIFTYYVSQSLNGCEGPKAPIVVLIQGTPPAPAVGSSQVYCQGGSATPVSATASPGGTLNWYTTPTGGSSSLTPPTPALTTTGTVVYYVSQSMNGCEGPRATVTVTIKSAPLAPTVAASPAYCQGTVATPLVAAPAPGGTLTWYTTLTGGAGTSAAPIPATGSAGTIVYYVSQTDITGCESNRAPVTVRINALPTSPTTASVSYCQGATAVPLSALPNSGNSLNWYTAQTGGTAVTVAPVPITTNAGVNTYYVSQTDANGCESTRSLLLVIITPTPTAPSVTPLAPVCQNSAPIVLQAAGQNLKWYADATSVNNMGNSVTVSTAQAGPFSYYVSQTINLCESPRTLVQGVVNALPLPPVIANQNVCQDAPALPLTAIGTGLQWFDSNDAPITVPTPVTKVDANQTYIYKVSQTISGCTSLKAIVLYTVNVTPLPTVITPVSYCQNAVAKPLEASGSSLRWFSPAGALTTVAPIPPTNVVTAGASYSVSQISSLGCESRKAEIKVTVNALPTAKLDGTTTVSLGNSAILSLTLTGTGPYGYVLSDGAVGTAETSVNSDITISKITVTPSATKSYSVVSVTNACGNGTVSGVATITVEVPSILTGALPASSICTGALLTVPFLTSGKFTAANTFVVEIASATGDSLSRRYTPIANGLLQGGTVVTTIPSTVAAGLYYIRVSATNAPYAVPGIRSPTLLTVKALPTASFSAAKRLIYKGETTELLVSLSGDAPWTVSYAAGSEIRSAAATKNLSSLTVTPATTTTYKLLSVSNTCGVGKIEGVDTTTIRVDVLLAEVDPFGNSVKVYPVPAEGMVTVDIDLPLQKEPAKLQLIGFDGHITEQVSTRQKQTTLSLDKVSAGTYLLYITIGDKTAVRKILKR